MLFRHNKLLPGLLHVRTYASIAFIDHVNAPLLWDKKMVHKQFNCLWHHVPTFAPYNVEGVFFRLVLGFLHKEAQPKPPKQQPLSYRVKCSECLQDSCRVLWISDPTPKNNRIGLRK